MNQVNIGSGNGLAPDRRQAITGTNAGLLSIALFGNKFQWNLNQNSTIFIQENSLENIVFQNGGHFDQGEMT